LVTFLFFNLFVNLSIKLFSIAFFQALLELIVSMEVNENQEKIEWEEKEVEVKTT